MRVFYTWFHWLFFSEWQQVFQISRTVPSILADLKNVAVWMFSILPLICCSYIFPRVLRKHSQGSKYDWLLLVLKWFIIIFLKFFNSLARSGYFSRYLPYFTFSQLSAVIRWRVVFFSLFFITGSSILSGTVWSVSLSKSQRTLCVSFPRIGWMCPWCNGYRRRKWTRWHKFKSWTRLIAFNMALIPLGKVWIQLFSLQLSSRTD